MSPLSILLHPMATLNRWLENDPNGSGVDVLYLLTTFFGFGIWLVFRRYHNFVTQALDFEWPAPEAADPGWTSYPIDDANLESHLQNNDLMPNFVSRERRYITCYDPSTSLHIGTLLADNEEEIQRKIDLAAHAQREWQGTSFVQRRRVIRSLNKWLVENQELCARVACRDTGKTLIDASLGEILTTCSKMEWLIKHGEQALRHETRTTNWLLSYKKSKVYYDPLGVVAAIVSWNYPLHNAWSPIIASIFAGNAVVLKCSENVVWSTTWFVGAIQECLRACHFNPDIVQLVCCWPDDAEILTKSPTIRHITFIGSETVGRKVVLAAAENLTPVTLELGGKDPAIILPGTDLNKWSSIWMRGIFQNAGQNCIGIERVIVHSSQHDDLSRLLAERVEKLRSGSVLSPGSGGYVPCVDVGAMISSARFAGLETQISEAKKAGAHVVNGARYMHPFHNGGKYFTPTIVDNVSPEMDIANHELFAPVAVLIPYDDVEEAIKIANGTRYGLGASVFGPYQNECLRVAKALECGMVSVNDFGVFYLNQDLPFGGTKASGYGRFGGPEGLRALTNPKVIVEDRFPSFLQTKIPTVLDYPIPSLKLSWDFISGLVNLMYADGWRARFNGLIKLLQVPKR